jgi:hypothetical protein
MRLDGRMIKRWGNGDYQCACWSAVLAYSLDTCATTPPFKFWERDAFIGKKLWKQAVAGNGYWLERSLIGYDAVEDNAFRLLSLSMIILICMTSL